MGSLAGSLFDITHFLGRRSREITFLLLTNMLLLITVSRIAGDVCPLSIIITRYHGNNCIQALSSEDDCIEKARKADTFGSTAGIISLREKECSLGISIE